MKEIRITKTLESYAGWCYDSFSWKVCANTVRKVQGLMEPMEIYKENEPHRLGLKEKRVAQMMLSG